MSAAAKEKGTTMSVKDKAESYFSTYVKLYDEIVQGYEAGTRETYVFKEGGYRKLTKEEELSALDKAFGKIAGDFEKRETVNQNARKRQSLKKKQKLTVRKQQLRRKARKQPVVSLKVLAKR